MQKRSFMQALIALVVALASLAGCDDTAAPPTPSSCDGGCDSGAPGRWRCPEGWVAYERGGCGPAVLLCAAGGGAAAGACEGEDVDGSRAPIVALPDGGTIRGLYRLPDGGIGGAWPEPGDPDGPPPLDWSPDAGVGAPAAGWSPDAGIAACPMGWRRTEDGACDPTLGVGCPAGSEPLPGGRCTPTGERDCPAGAWPDLGAEGVGVTPIYARAGADAAAADGTERNPYPTLAAAITRAGDGGWVLAAGGEYRERLVVTSGSHHLLGRCAASVVLVGPGPVGPAGATLVVDGPGTTMDLRGVTITGAGRGAYVINGSSLQAVNVRLVNNADEGVLARDEGTRVNLTGSVVSGTRLRSDGTFGRGLEANGGARVLMTGVAVTNNHEAGVQVGGASTRVDLVGSVVAGTLPWPEGTRGYGVRVQGGVLNIAQGVVADNVATGVALIGQDATATLADVVVRGNGDGAVAVQGGVLRGAGLLIDRNSRTGVSGTGGNSRAELSASIVRGTVPGAIGGGLGISEEDGAVLLAAGVIVEGNTSVGVKASGAGSQAELRSCIVRGTRADAEGRYGMGVEAIAGGALLLAETLVMNNSGNGVRVEEEGSRAALDRVVIRGTRQAAAEMGAAGLAAGSGGRITAEHVLVAGNAVEGVRAMGAGTEIELVSSVVSDTLPLASGENGEGVAAYGGAAVRAIGVVVRGNANIGVGAVGAGTRVTLSECVVRDTRGAHADGAGGVGVLADEGAALTADGLLADNNAESAVLARDAGTVLTLTRGVVRGTRPGADGLTGDGVSVADGATLRASRVRVSNNRSSGVVAQGAGALLDLASSIIQGTLTRRDGDGGLAALAHQGASLRMVGVSMTDNVNGGVITDDAGTEVELFGCAVRAVRSNSGGFLGRGLFAGDGVHLYALQTLVADNAETGVFLLGAGTEARLVDSLIVGVVPSAAGLGLGLYLDEGARATVERLGIDAVYGAGIAAVPFNEVSRTDVRGGDLWIHNVRPSTVRLRADGVIFRPEGVPAAYGVHTGSGCGLDLARVVIDDGDYGFFNAGGTLRIREGVIARQREAAGVIDGATRDDAWTLERVLQRDNGMNGMNGMNGVGRRPGLTSAEVDAPSR